MIASSMIRDTIPDTVLSVTCQTYSAAFLIAFNRYGKVAVAKKNDKLSLLGGGLQNHETHRECIIRSCREMTGIQVNVGKFLYKGEKYLWSDDMRYFMRCNGYFYFGEIDNLGSINHSDIAGISIDEYLNRLSIDFHGKPVNQTAWNFKKY